MRGWFDLFRDNGGPTLYAYSNRTPVVGDVHAITLYIAFTTLLVAFLIIFPGIRRERFATFTSVILSLFVGVSILIGTYGTGWHTAEGDVSSAYRSFSNEKIFGRLGIYIGLNQVNITLMAMPVFGNDSNDMDINFNEKFGFRGATELREEFKEALIKGLPFPILTVAEYLSLDGDGFCWGRSYRSAGYYASIFLWSSFALWLMMNMLLLVVPRYGAYLMIATGTMMLFVNLLYYLMLPGRPLLIHLEDMVMTFQLGWCYWLVLTSGSLCLIIGTSISVIDLIYPHKFSTILEMDYGTPFDRHTIIEDSHETKKKKKWLPKLEEPASVGLGGLLRRLSKRDRDRTDIQRNPMGEDNYAYEMEMGDAPKSPWRYPHLMFRDSRKHKTVSFKKSGDRHATDSSAVGGASLTIPPHILQRTDSKDSSVSSMCSIPYQGKEELRQTLSVPASAFHKKFHRTDSGESSNSSLASFGLSLLYRNNSRKTPRGHFVPPPPPSRGMVERNDSSGTLSSAAGVAIELPSIYTSSSISSTASKNSPSTVVAFDEPAVNAATGNSEEVTIIKGRRKNSTTKAVRRNSAEHRRDEASMW